MKKLISILVAFVAIFGTFALGTATATAARAATVTITFDADGNTTLPIAASAEDWSKNTDVSAVTGNCTGTRCIHFRVIEGTCPTGNLVGGCAYRIADGGCQVDVRPWVVEKGKNLPLLVTKHEAGHCIFSYGGKSTSFHLPQDPLALMSPTHSYSPTLKEATLTHIDRSFTRSLF